MSKDQIGVVLDDLKILFKKDEILAYIPHILI